MIAGIQVDRVADGYAVFGISQDGGKGCRNLVAAFLAETDAESLARKLIEEKQTEVETESEQEARIAKGWKWRKRVAKYRGRLCATGAT